MMKKYLYLLTFFLLIQLSACISSQGDENVEIYFSLPKFLNQQIQQLDSQKPQVKKTVINDAKIETQNLSIADWRKELKMFIEADINKSIFKDSYQVQAVKSGEKFQKNYQALKSHLKTKNLRVVYNQAQKIQRIEVDYAESNFLFGSDKKLILECNPQTETIQSYHIKGHQSNLFGYKSHYEVKGDIL